MTSTLILAHRGARKYAPENSVSAFKKAIELELDGVEFDVLSTSDGVPVVIHDDNLHKLTGKRLHVHKTPYIGLKDVDIGARFHPYFSGERIPTLKETLEVFAGTNFLLNIEIKQQHHQHKHFIQDVVETLNNSGLKNEQIIVSSFDRKILYQVGRIAPHLNRSLLVRPSAFFFLDILFSANILRVTGINPHISILNKFVMLFAKIRNWKVLVWTANEPEQIKKALGLACDGIMTDDPLLAKEILKDH